MRLLIHNPAGRELFSQSSAKDLDLTPLSADALVSAAERFAGNDQMAILLVEEGALALLRRLRQTGFNGPLMVLEKNSHSASRVELLYAGADDVVALPVEPAELTARVIAVVRRLRGISTDMVRLGELEFYLDGRHPEFCGQEIKLSAREYDILRHLTLNANRVVSKEAIYDALYALSTMPPFDRIIDVYICRLRAKMHKIRPESGSYITTLPGRGYYLSAPEKAEVRPH